MSFIATVATQIVQWLLTKVGSFLVAAWQKMSRRKEIKEEAQASVEPLKAATDAKSIDEATDSALDKF